MTQVNATATSFSFGVALDRPGSIYYQVFDPVGAPPAKPSPGPSLNSRRLLQVGNRSPLMEASLHFARAWLKRKRKRIRKALYNFPAGKRRGLSGAGAGLPGDLHSGQRDGVPGRPRGDLGGEGGPGGYLEGPRHWLRVGGKIPWRSHPSPLNCFLS